jgi:hypothetical protein
MIGWFHLLPASPPLPGDEWMNESQPTHPSFIAAECRQTDCPSGHKEEEYDEDDEDGNHQISIKLRSQSSRTSHTASCTAAVRNFSCPLDPFISLFPFSFFLFFFFVPYPFFTPRRPQEKDLPTHHHHHHLVTTPNQLLIRRYIPSPSTNKRTLEAHLASSSVKTMRDIHTDQDTPSLEEI